MIKITLACLTLSVFAFSSGTSLAAAVQSSTAPAQPSTAPEPSPHPTTADPIKDLVADPETAAILEKHLPGVTTHPALPQFEQMTLVEAMPMSQGEVTSEKIAAIEAEIQALSDE